VKAQPMSRRAPAGRRGIDARAALLPLAVAVLLAACASPGDIASKAQLRPATELGLQPASSAAPLVTPT
jgi:uncharacterized lipoprotein YmbA